MKGTFAATLWVAAAMIAAPAWAEGNEARGERLFNQQCKACHTVEKGGASTVGPNLHGLLGRKAGSEGGYQSSDAMKTSGIVWDDKTLADYLKDPKGKVPGTKMVYIGLKQDAQQQDMIAYLKKATQ
ncbi:MAG: cytochrome c family protein [Reyranella sp.]|uniref:c-type cytochrome n=1 Tax=Reyranella sp. TaxID=1929291 RepID=UPI001AD4911D|nr:cytochrome c family protein [Reyranella sp.]MBN9086061.1 cytochrome c family protein [Reyranella sp.]